MLGDNDLYEIDFYYQTVPNFDNEQGISNPFFGDFAEHLEYRRFVRLMVKYFPIFFINNFFETVYSPEDGDDFHDDYGDVEDAPNDMENDDFAHVNERSHSLEHKSGGLDTEYIVSHGFTDYPEFLFKSEDSFDEGIESYFLEERNLIMSHFISNLTDKNSHIYYKNVTLVSFIFIIIKIKHFINIKKIL